MFRAILETQWKWTRAFALAATLIGFALPIASLQSAQGAFTPSDFVLMIERWGVTYAILAAGLGLAVAFAAWSHDHRGRHLYALSLPITRARYAMLRLAAGAIFIVPTVVAVFVGCLLVTMLGGIPEGLRTYPFALTLRFAFAALVAYALFFAVAASTQKTAGIILGVIVAFALVQYGLEVASVRFDILSPVLKFLFESPGVFSVFAGRWTLIDA